MNALSQRSGEIGTCVFAIEVPQKKNVCCNKPRPSVESETMSSPANHVRGKKPSSPQRRLALTRFHSRKSKNRRIGFALVTLFIVLI